MQEFDALFAAVVAAPDQTPPREAYADAVEALDPDRAELIRLQLRMAEATARQADSYPASLRALHLVETNGHRWAGQINQFVSAWSFRRGFVEIVAVDAAWFLESAEDLYAMAPILHLDLTDVRPVAAELFGSPWLARIRSISLLHEGLGDAEAALIATSPQLGNLRWLQLSNNKIGPDGLESLASSQGLPKLGYLGLAFNPVEDPTPRFADEYDATSAAAERLQERYGHRDWLDARPRWKWPPEREAMP